MATNFSIKQEDNIPEPPSPKQTLQTISGSLVNFEINQDASTRNEQRISVKNSTTELDSARSTCRKSTRVECHPDELFGAGHDVRKTQKSGEKMAPTSCNNQSILRDLCNDHSS